MSTRFALSFAIALLAGLVAGCQRPDEIERYPQPKPSALLKTYFGETGEDESEAPRPKPSDRMFAAIVPHGKQYWFFKLVGPADTVRPLSDAFAQFVGSIEFKDAEADPQWQLPKDWRGLPGSGTGPAARFATIQIGSGDKPLELTVTSLPRGGDDDENDALLMNVNRWRRQMSMAPLEREQLDGAIRKRKTESGTAAYVLGLAGRFQTGGMARPPMAGGDQPDLPTGHPDLPVGHPAIEQGPPPSEAGPKPAGTTANGEFGFQAPPEWQTGKTSAMRKAAYEVRDSAHSVEITVVTLAPQAADIVANVNRWRGQLKLPAADEKEIAPTVKQLPLGDVKGSYVEILGPKDPGPQQAILGVIAPRGDMVWSVTMRGDAELAEREKPRFEAFVKSFQFGSMK